MDMNPEDVAKLTDPNAFGGIVRVRSNSNIEIKVNSTQEPITQFIDAVLQLSNHPLLDILPIESKGAALKYLSSIMGSAPTLDQSEKLHEMDSRKEYLLFVNPHTTNLDDITAIKNAGANINVVRVM